MLHEERIDVDQHSGPELLAEYETVLAEIVEEHGVEQTAKETGIDRETLEALIEGESPEIDLEDAAVIEALATDLDVEVIHAEALDHLLMGMSMAVVDVDTLAGDIEGDLSGKEVQQKLERRAPMTLEEFAAVEYAIASRRR